MGQFHRRHPFLRKKKIFSDFLVLETLAALRIHLCNVAGGRRFDYEFVSGQSKSTENSAAVSYHVEKLLEKTRADGSLDDTYTSANRRLISAQRF